MAVAGAPGMDHAGGVCESANGRAGRFEHATTTAPPPPPPYQFRRGGGPPPPAECWRPLRNAADESEHRNSTWQQAPSPRR